MAFIVPTFNLTANYWSRPTWLTTWPISIAAPDLANFPCAIRALERAPDLSGIGFGAAYPTQLLAPKLTDLRGPSLDHPDTMLDWPIIEVPSGSSQYYFLLQVADVAKGYSNEYRLAWLYSAQGAHGT